MLDQEITQTVPAVENMIPGSAVSYSGRGYCRPEKARHKGVIRSRVSQPGDPDGLVHPSLHPTPCLESCALIRSAVWVHATVTDVKVKLKEHLCDDCQVGKVFPGRILLATLDVMHELVVDAPFQLADH